MKVSTQTKTPRKSMSVYPQNISKATPLQSEYLSDISEREKPWDKNKSFNVSFSNLLKKDEEFAKRVIRLKNCAEELWFGRIEDSIKLVNAHFCRIRSCPVCQWRRSLMWFARFNQAFSKILAEYPKDRYLFITLTVKNCEIENLRKTIQHMNKSWNRFVKRKDLNIWRGWIRTVEVTRNAENNSAHPHFHILVQVPSYYFNHGYIRHDKYIELWQSACQLDYEPVVNIKAVKAAKADISNGISKEEAIFKAVRETLKYSVKPTDLISDKDWTKEFMRQTHKLRFVASGGTMKDVLQDVLPTQDELIKGKEGEGDQEEKSPELCFGFEQQTRRYKRKAEDLGQQKMEIL